MRVEVVDVDALKFAYGVALVLFEKLALLSLTITLLAFSVILLAYSVGEVLAHWKRRRKRRMWAEVGEILENSGFNDEEGGDWWLVHI